MHAENLFWNEYQIQCEAQKYVHIEHCLFLKYENIVEVGFLRNYTQIRIDVPGSDNFFYDFWAISFTIKNLATPYFVKDSYPLIKMGMYNGSGIGWGDLIGYTNFTVETSPSFVDNVGVTFDNDFLPDNVTSSKVMDTFFAPY